MSFFDRVKTSATNLGSSIAKGANQFVGKSTVETKEAAKIAVIKAELDALQAELDHGYIQIGKAYVDACIARGEVVDIGVEDILKILGPKLDKKVELEQKIIELEKTLADSQIMQERSIVQEEFDKVKAKLDKALGMGALTREEYDVMLLQAGKKLRYFDEIRMLKKQKDLGIIDSNEYDVKLEEILSR